MVKRLKRLIAVMQKETIQMLRDRPTLLMILFLPVVELLLIASVGDVLSENLSTAVADLSMDARSRDFVAALEVSEFFEVEMNVDSEADVIRAIDDGEVGIGVVIPPDFAEQVERSEAQVLVILDGSDSFLVQSGYSAASAIGQAYAMDLVMEMAERMGMAGMGNLPIYTSTRILYNPNMDDMMFLIPGLAATLLQLLAINISVMAVVREREMGTMEQILVTPTRPVELIVGKMIPAIFLIAADLTIIMLMGVYYFGVPFQGSVWLFVWLSFLFIISGLGLGLLLSTVAKNQGQAQQMTTVLMLLTMLLTGLIYPRSMMPEVAQTIGNFIPATYFTRIARGIITKGIGLELLWDDVWALVIYGAVIVVLSAVTFKKRLD
jgi:ABC-2 type transport system permease protein